jgi:hypothetical protein
VRGWAATRNVASFAKTPANSCACQLKAFDALTWLGHWPFAFLAERNASGLARHLRAHGIDRALVIPARCRVRTGAGRPNRALFRAQFVECPALRWCR